MLKRLLGVAALSVCVVSSYSHAEKAPNVSDEAVKQGGKVEELVLAADLARLGLEDQDPLMLITAAKIQKLTGSTQKDREKESAGEGQGEAEGEGQVLTTEYLLNQAEQLSGENEAYLALIESVRALKTRRATGGPYHQVDRVQARDTDIWEIRFNGQELAEVGVAGDGDTDLDLYVFDSNGNLICSDTDYTDRMYCSWNPRRSGDFLIKIKNLGGVYNQYEILTN